MTRITLSPSGKSVEAENGETVLSALERAGYALPNNCRAGACGECKVKVLSGSFDQGLVLDMALSPQERIQGFGLMCMAKPTCDDLTIEWGTADAKPKLFPPKKSQPFVVTDRIARTDRVAELHLRPVGQPMRFWPGQYVVLGGQGGPAPRCYSIANAPRPDGEIILQIARIDGLGTSQWVHETLLPGTVLSLDGPYGTFIGDPAVETPILCMAAGTGLAPILALTEAALRRNYRKPVMLVISARTEADVYGRGLLDYWQRRYRNFKYRITLTREQKEGYLHGRIGEVLPSLFTELSAHGVFVAGSPEFVEAACAGAQALGAQPEHIHTEGYFGQAMPETPPQSQLVA
ncbi:MAG: 2Fe-2S iron-sulfur cluster-binding protein [Sphingobium sp.]|jgi:CDP-4-dehydro-6-deoxyglucose reductase|nr:2Fe-2S iron-sulfur cluster-binding protein [Sphingobium sp.]MCI1271442.1 2Fe-2S iron-sulfur cluster-binding protein [Sphingobium sp.]MCI1755659.1 2Fe-2S iron-sulfur cluster-binding protein [Sphingobium sp.]MCI2052555.1 2Fe-2S iron-sulfur cluster-binding protein [Sphingobium sp.]